MDHNKNSTKKEDNSNNQENISSEPNAPIEDTKGQKQTSNSTNKPTSNKKTISDKRPRIIWSIQDIIQIILAGLTLLTLIFYVVFSKNQASQTREAINRADTANSLTEQTIELTKISSRISDSLNRKAINIADSSMKISKKIAGIQEKYTKIELRAYITILEVVPYFLEVGKNFGIGFHFVNYGKTPAFNIKCFSGYRLGNPEFIERDMKHCKEFKSTSADTKGTDLDGSFICDYGKIVDSPTLDSIKNDKIQYFVFGYVSYNDIFGDNHKSYFINKYSNGEMNTYEYKQP